MVKKPVRPLLIILVFCCLCELSFAAPKEVQTQILFQAFTWNGTAYGQEGKWYDLLAEKAPEIATLGVTHVWFPPVSRSLAPQGYLPLDYYDLGSEGNPTFYGHYHSLKRAVSAFKNAGISSVADIVVNHRCANKQQDGQWNVYDYPSGKARWERWALAAGDYGGTGNPDSGDDYGAAPDIDHKNEQVRKDISEWLRWLRDDIGFVGLRLDFAKGFAPEFARTYARAINSPFTVSEVWTPMNYDGSGLTPNQDGHRQYLCNYLDGAGGAVSAFDFTTKGILQVACERGEYWRLRDENNKPTGLLGWWPSRAITFVDNHDTGSTQAHWPFPGHKVLEGYAYILTHPGTPTIFWDHVFQWGDDHQKQISALARLRIMEGIHAESEIEILHADHNLYVATIDGKVLVKLGQNHYAPGQGWKVALSGNGYTIWSQKGMKYSSIFE